MEYLYINLLFIVVFGAYIYKISYYYDYKYVGNLIRFVTFYVLTYFIISFALFQLNLSSLSLMTTLLLVSGIVMCILYKRFLVNKFGKEERFASSKEIEDIGNTEE